jgi:SAM-dependent methyltransferase
MSDWTAGYVADIGYTFGYYSELNPARLRLAFLNAGLAVPEVVTACELGFGQGLSANMHGAGSLTQWHGTDFNPAQAGFARELARASGANVSLFDDAFAEFAERKDLPDFDFIGLHGIWSWISDQNRAVIVDFVRRKLKVGGVLYVSYNTLPGWATFAPMRHLMVAHADTIGATGHGIVQRINGALDFAGRLLATEPTYARANPQVGDRIRNMKDQSRHYLAHEYFNRDWLPMHFRTMVEWLEPAKVDFACSAHYLDLVEGLNLSPEQHTFLGEIPDAMFKESVRDFMVNQQFRRDYWVKGARRISAIERDEALRAQRVLLISHRPDIVLKVSGGAREATLNQNIYVPVLDALAEHRILSLGQLEKVVKAKGVTFPQLLQAVVVLTGAAHVVAVQDDATAAAARPQTERLNAYILAKARGSGDIGFLASPVSGGGVPVDRFQQLCLLAMSQGKKEPKDWAAMSWQLLAAQGQKLRKENKTLETAEENLAELLSQAQVFAAKRLPILKALQIV